MTQEQDKAKSPEKIRIIISLDQQTGALSVAGPTHNKLLCAHMIADALKAIMDTKTQIVHSHDIVKAPIPLGSA